MFERDEFSRSLIDGSLDCLKVLDLDGRVLLINTAGLGLLELDDYSSLCGQPWATLWPQEAHAQLRDAMDSARAGKPGSFRAFCPTAKGTPKWWDVFVSPIREAPQGPVTRLMVVSRDVTAQRDAEQALRDSEERLRLATEAADVGLWDVDPVNDKLYWPPRVKAMFGISADDPVSMADFYAGLHPEDREPTREAFASALDPERRALYNIEYRTVGKEDGVVRWVAARGRGIFDEDGTCIRVIGTAIDVTAHKRTEQALRESEAQLLRSNRAKDEFLAMLGHELRNPLAPIVTTLQLMKLRAPDTLAAERDAIESQVRHISDMVDDLLDVARIARGKVVLNAVPVDIADVVAAASEAARPLIDERRQKLQATVAKGLVVSGDRRRLVQVLVNLLTNAAKYSPEDKAIWIDATQEHGEAVVRVRDEGDGIAQALLPYVFEMFTQEQQSIDRAQGGLGLGLAIVRNLVELHGGSVSASSGGPKRGSEFVVRLPLLKQQATPGAETIPSKRAPGRVSGKPVKVLVVDDYLVAAESTAALLQALGFETRIAHDGASALGAAVEFMPAVALVDIGLPVMNGYELARQLRATPGMERLSLVALTGYGQESDRDRAFESGFDEHLVKPIDAEKLEQVIERMVMRKCSQASR